jgi:hypothetical protein
MRQSLLRRCFSGCAGNYQPYDRARRHPMSSVPSLDRRGTRASNDRIRPRYHLQRFASLCTELHHQSGNRSQAYPACVVEPASGAADNPLASGRGPAFIIAILHRGVQDTGLHC